MEEDFMFDVEHDKWHSTNTETQQTKESLPTQKNKAVFFEQAPSILDFFSFENKDISSKNVFMLDKQIELIYVPSVSFA